VIQEKKQMIPSPGKRLRELIDASEIEVVVGIYDGLSARLVEKMGYTSATISGSALSESNLGWEDVGLMGLEENVRASAAITSVANIPLMADGDTGYGNAINAYYTLQRFEAAGVAGLMIEDQVWPKRCGHLQGKEVISAEEMVDKVRACCDARRDASFVVKARTDAFAIFGLDETIRRLNLYADAGADLLFADALLSEQDIATVVRNVSKPLQVNMGFGIRQRSTTPLIPAKRLEELGVAIVSYPRILTASAVQGMINSLSVLKEAHDAGTIVERPDLLISMDELVDMMGLTRIRELEQRYLSEETLRTKYGEAAKRRMA
jgi:2-methylisocitrate lyase-like PEP mutase family enzyme